MLIIGLATLGIEIRLLRGGIERAETMWGSALCAIS